MSYNSKLETNVSVIGNWVSNEIRQPLLKNRTGIELNWGFANNG